MSKTYEKKVLPTVELYIAGRDDVVAKVAAEVPAGQSSSHRSRRFLRPGLAGLPDLFESMPHDEVRVEAQGRVDHQLCADETE